MSPKIEDEPEIATIETQKLIDVRKITLKQN